MLIFIKLIMDFGFNCRQKSLFKCSTIFTEKAFMTDFTGKFTISIFLGSFSGVFVTISKTVKNILILTSLKYYAQVCE